MLFALQVEMAVDDQFCKIFNEYPGEAIGPDQTGIHEWYRGYEPAKNHDQDCECLGAKNSSQEQRTGVRGLEKKASGCGRQKASGDLPLPISEK
jgi:hypothetical protein